MKNFTLFPVLYLIIALVELYSEITSERALHLASKPLLVLLVGVIFLTSTRGSNHPAKKFVLWGLLFSWFGDVLLMFKQEFSGSFVSGLGAFLIAHIFYIIAYRQGSGGKFTLSYFVFVPIIGYGVVLFSVLAPYLGTMLLPVAIYSIVLLGMLVAALERGGRTSQESFWWVVAGAVCFVGSDSILAWHSFVEPSVVARVSLMALYIAAQYAIARGMALHISNDVKPR
ncbi:MAG: lysoplasmalogenase [Candidatus Kapaibacteriota bacterium]